MTVGNEELPLPHGFLPVASNFVYWVLAAFVPMMGGPPIISAMISIALVLQGAASMTYHATVDKKKWAQLLDAVGIQWVQTALIGAGVVGLLPWANALVIPIVLAAWVLAWMFINRVPRIPLIVAQAVVLVVMVGFLESWGLAAFLFVLISAAFGIQQYTDSHSSGHAMWHLFSCFAQYIGTSALL